MAMDIIETDQAPAAIGPYSQAVKVSDFLYCSGQIPLDPQTGEVVDGDISVQAERVMANVKAVLAAADCDFSHIVKTTIFMQDLQDFAVVNEIYGRCFSGPAPARSTVQVAGLPKGVLLEVEVVAYLGG